MAIDPDENPIATLARIHPELAAVREVAEEHIYLVGGAVRDLLLGRARADVDLVVEGDAATLAESLGADVVSHERFATAKMRLDGHEVDIASARSESYPTPGSLPVVEPAASIEADLARRDFTINAMAIPLRGDPYLIDPHGGQEDLDAGLLRVLHSRSFEDDPTRAIRAARYAVRFDFALEAGTEQLLRAADLGTVSDDRRRAEMRRLATEPRAVRGFGLLAEWGLITSEEGQIALAGRVDELLSSPPWKGVAPRDQALLAAVLEASGRGAELVAARPELASEAVELARRHDPVALILARVAGAEWLDRYVGTWRSVALEIDGSDLIAAGIPQGPAVGAGLREAWRRKLDGDIGGRERELEVALDAARMADGVE